MSYERSPDSLLVPELEVYRYDESLKPELDAILGVTKDDPSFLEVLKPDGDQFATARDRAQETGRVEDYDALFDIRPAGPIPKSYDVREEKLRQFRKVLRAKIQTPLSDREPDIEDVVDKLYLWRTNELIAETQIMHAISEGDVARTRILNRFLYGGPNPEVHAATVTHFRQRVDGALSNENSTVRRAARFAEQHLPQVEGDVLMLQPIPELFEAVRREHFGEMGYFPLLFAGVELPKKGPIRPDVGEPILQQVMENTGIAEYERKIQSGAWSLDNDRGTVNGPGKYALPLKRFIGLPAGHEIGSHALESINGSRQPLLLMADGLDHYERGNEGRAVIREQVPYETFTDFAGTRRWEDILRRHLATSYLAGMWPEGTTSRDFVQTLSALDIIFEDSQNKKGLSSSEVIEKAQKRTWSLVERVIGRKIYKDMLYLEGNIDDWNVADRIESGDLGKFDIANDRHTSRLERLAIL